MINIQHLHQQLTAALIPIVGVVNADNTKPGLSIQYAPEATQQQINAGNAILAAFDIAAPTPEETAEANALTDYATWKTRLATLKNAIQTLLGGVTTQQIDAQVTNAGNAFSTWNFGAIAPSVARENALFVAVAGLYIGLFILLKRNRL